MNLICGCLSATGGTVIGLLAVRAANPLFGWQILSMLNTPRIQNMENLDNSFQIGKLQRTGSRLLYLEFGQEWSKKHYLSLIVMCFFSGCGIFVHTWGESTEALHAMCWMEVWVEDCAIGSLNYQKVAWNQQVWWILVLVEKQVKPGFTNYQLQAKYSLAKLEGKGN